MNRWSILSLRDVGVELIDCLHKTPAAQTEGYPYVGIPQMRDGWIDFGSARKISHDDFVEWTTKAMPQQHDVILSRRTNPGVTAIDRTGTEFALGQNLVLLRADGIQIDPPFLKWLVRSPAWWQQVEKFMNVGAVFNSLRCADVPNFELPVPPFETQRRMGNLLDVLESAIDMNRRMNETLEAMARAIFKDWFVDFGPTRAKAEGRAPYLAPDIWDLFPDALDDEGKPVGWDWSKIASMASTKLGGTPSRKKPELWGGSVPWINSGKVNQLRVISPSEFITTEGLENSSAKLLPKRTTLIAITGATLGQVSLSECETSTNQSVVGIVGNDRMLNEFLYCWIRENIGELLALQTGAAQQHINKGNVDQLAVLSPAAEVLNSWVSLSRPLFDLIALNCFESETLSVTRDLLLPKLMSGEIRLRDAERAVEAVA